MADAPAAAEVVETASEPLVVDQYGSNLKGASTWPPSLAAVEKMRADEALRGSAKTVVLVQPAASPPRSSSTLQDGSGVSDTDSEAELVDAEPQAAGEVTETGTGVLRRRRTKPAASGLPRKSARLHGLDAAVPSAERAELRAAVRNLEIPSGGDT